LGQGLAQAEALGDPSSRAAALNNLALVCQAQGDSTQAIQLTEQALALCEAQGDRHRAAALHNNLADLLHAAGQPDAAMDQLKQAVAIFAEIGEPGQPEIWKLVAW
jgi:tetratricopeptide (TPR) repeat protein